MKIKDLLNKFNLNLNLTDEVLDIEIEGNYLSYQVLEDDDGRYYSFEDDAHEVIIDDTNINETIIYSTDLMEIPKTTIYAFNGLVVGVS